MIKQFVTWLEKRHLNHAVIVLIGMWPMTEINILLGGGAKTAAFCWVFGYYIREVSGAEGFNNNGYFKALWPGNWPSYHDQIQTVYMVCAALIWVVIYNSN